MQSIADLLSKDSLIPDWVPSWLVSRVDIKSNFVKTCGCVRVHLGEGAQFANRPPDHKSGIGGASCFCDTDETSSTLGTCAPIDAAQRGANQMLQDSDVPVALHSLLAKTMVPVWMVGEVLLKVTILPEVHQAKCQEFVNNYVKRMFL